MKTKLLLNRYISSELSPYVKRMDPFYKNQVISHYNQAVTLLGNKIDANLSKSIALPERMIRINLPFQKDNGTTSNVYGYHIQHSNHIFPCQGGLKISEDINALSIGSQAFMVTLRNALANIPFGGSKGGINVDPSTCSE